MKIKKGDDVIVIAGKDKGATGKVIAADPKRERVVVEGVNLVKRHTRETNQGPRGAKEGGIVTKEGADPRQQRGARRGRQAHPRRLPHRRRRHEGPRFAPYR